MKNDSSSKLLSLIHLVNSSLPLGGYNYSSGFEYVIESGCIHEPQLFCGLINDELLYGFIRIELAVIVKNSCLSSLQSVSHLNYWNRYLHGFFEAKELRRQSIQMGNSLLKLLGDLDQAKRESIGEYRQVLGKDCHYAIAFGIAVALWEIEPKDAVLGYLHSWVTNLVGAGVKLIPLGQTQGQQIIYDLHPVIATVADELIEQNEDHLYACSWGSSLASMNHETMYSRLFRS
ncbi:MAG: urease accessory protein UreF [Limnothrix sp. RL_2_0]|nr:urease accessory protein UreF [Limnothrix sp. RL_2_0]